MAPAVFYFQDTLVHYFSSGIEQFDIQGFAQFGCLVQFGGYDVTCKPNIIALIVTGVIEMQVDFSWGIYWEN